jgi:aminopeptidase-like protein
MHPGCCVAARPARTTILSDVTDEIDSILRRLFPLNRSITGNGNRETLATLAEIVPLQVIEYPSGTPVFDWRIPQEWNVREAWIKDASGQRIVDFATCNVHLMGYSEPVRGRFSFEDLLPHLHYREDLPAAIPYRTSYYHRDWAFCVSHEQFRRLFVPGESYEVCIDTEFKDGALSVGELLIPGRSRREVLVSTYLCHPSLANDNLSGVVLTAFLARELKRMSLNYSYRVVFVPETIGAIAYCAHNAAAMRAIDSGFVVTCTGGPGPFYVKQSFTPGHHLNRIVDEVLRNSGEKYVTYPFDVHGSDERQYSSQGFRINTISIGRDRYYEYPFYHTSLDNLDFVNAKQIVSSLEIYLETIRRLDREVVLRNRHPDCEVMLSKHDLYPKTGGALNFSGAGRSLDELDLILWLLFLCDGHLPLSDIALKLGVAEAALRPVAVKLLDKGALELVAGVV